MGFGISTSQRKMIGEIEDQIEASRCRICYLQRKKLEIQKSIGMRSRIKMEE